MKMKLINLSDSVICDHAGLKGCLRSEFCEHKTWHICKVPWGKYTMQCVDDNLKRVYKRVRCVNPVVVINPKRKA